MTSTKGLNQMKSEQFWHWTFSMKIMFWFSKASKKITFSDTKPLNFQDIWGLWTMHEVKKAGYWLSSSFSVFVVWDRVEGHKHAKNLENKANIQLSWPYMYMYKLVNIGFIIIMEKENYLHAVHSGESQEGKRVTSYPLG